LEAIRIESDQPHGIRADAWFGSIRTASKVSRRGHRGMFQVKQYHSLFPKAFIEEPLKEAPGRVHIILEGKTQCEVPSIVVGYQYSRKTILHFILTKKAVSLKEGKPYEMKYTDSYGHVCTCYVERPDAISKFFTTSNVIDTHNQLHQDLLQLEKKWLTKNPYFHLTTTLLGISVNDAFLLAYHHRIINHTTGLEEDKKIGIQHFSGMMAFQLLSNAKQLGCP
jgi:hypothetical protein